MVVVRMDAAKVDFDCGVFPNLLEHEDALGCGTNKMLTTPVERPLQS